MNSDRWGTLPARIFNARTEGKALDLPPAAEVPRTLDEAYALQDALHAAWGEPVAGWKIGATAAAVQAKFGTDQPFSGPFYKTNTNRSPARISRSRLQHTKIECEFAFRVMRDLPPRDRSYKRSEILDAVDAMIPAIEIVSPRFVEIPFGRAPLAIADWGVNGAMIVGSPVVDGWQPDDVKSYPVRLIVDGQEVAAGDGSAVMGDPIEALVWLANHLRVRGVGLTSGQLISTGTTTGIFDMSGHRFAVADFGSFGTVELELQQ